MVLETNENCPYKYADPTITDPNLCVLTTTKKVLANGGALVNGLDVATQTTTTISN